MFGSWGQSFKGRNLFSLRLIKMKLFPKSANDTQGNFLRCLSPFRQVAEWNSLQAKRGRTIYGRENYNCILFNHAGHICPGGRCPPPEQPTEPDNYCQDRESWKEWDTLVQKHPNDMDIQTFHALRIGLCVKIQRGVYRLTTQPSCLKMHISLWFRKNRFNNCKKTNFDKVDY